MVANNLNDDQEARRNEVSVEMLEPLETETDFLNRVITVDESWCFEHDTETKRQSDATVSKTEESSHEQNQNSRKW
jgi:hypothetical protein